MEPRKATDVLLDIETKVNALLDIVRSQDLVIKVLSNKLNDVMGKLEKQSQAAPKFTVEAIQQPVVAPAFPPGFTQIPAGDPERNIPIAAESKLPETSAPQGFRRNSRPETFAGSKDHLAEQEFPEFKMPVQIPKGPPGRQSPDMPPPGRTQGDVVTAMVPPQATANPRGNKGNKGVMGGPEPKGSPFAPPGTPNPMMAQEQVAPPGQPGHPGHSPQGQIPVMQRCVDKNGKSIFLADVEITDLSTGQPFFKTRTNGAGKWMASLGIGAYRVVVTKRASGNKGMLEAIQDVQVDGSKSPLELPMVIIKEKA